MNLVVGGEGGYNPPPSWDWTYLTPTALADKKLSNAVILCDIKRSCDFYTEAYMDRQLWDCYKKFKMFAFWS